MLDFVGQAVTPSTFHLVTLDFVLAILQLATLLVAFGATVPSDLDSSSSGEAGRDYGPLLGVDEEEVFDKEETGGEAGPGMRRRRRSRNGYESVEPEDEEEDGQWIGGAVDAYGPSSAKPPSPSTSSSAFSTSSSALSSSRYTRIPLIADFRLRTVWTEIARSSPSRTEVEDRGVEAMEEGRAAG
uniref:BY PROTMAP: gi/647394963/emb/CDR36199.1/ RHTO0S01e16424g1_1 [Rhodosporidium toruloides] n=1 Tax=Rhodotorula toruloides TaxID=5286 RepID=A0A0K3C8S6_RHOTO